MPKLFMREQKDSKAVDYGHKSLMKFSMKTKFHCEAAIKFLAPHTVNFVSLYNKESSTY